MSAIEDIAKKYADEALEFAPLACVCSSVVGISLHHSAIRAFDRYSAWCGLLRAHYAEYWYFLDVAKDTSISWLLLAVLLSYVGLVAFRRCAYFFLKRGIETQAPRLREMYQRATQRVAEGSLVTTAADEWFKRSERKVSMRFKFGAFFCGAALETLAVIFLSASVVDMVVGIMLACISGALAWRFSILYYQAVLPKKLLADAALGLLEVDLLSEVSDMNG